MSNHEGPGTRIQTNRVGDSSSLEAIAVSVDGRRVRSLAPTIFCPAADVDSCVHQMRRAKVSQ